MSASKARPRASRRVSAADGGSGSHGRTASHCPAHEPLEPDPRDGQLVLHGIVRDSRSMQLLQQWHANQTPLTTAVSADRRFVAITDRRSRWAVVAEHS